MTLTRQKIKTANIKLSAGFTARVSLLDSRGNTFTVLDWQKSLKPSELLRDYESVLKQEGENLVFVKNITAGGIDLKVVIKKQCRKFRSPRAFRNFQTACRLLSLNIPTAWPIAAMHNNNNGIDIYITEFYPDCCDLLRFALDKYEDISQHHKTHIRSQIISILTALHKNGLCHRDTKASNFLVRKTMDGSYSLILIDLDGIKPYGIRKDTLQYRAISRLTASLLGASSVKRQDYSIAYNAYCEQLNIKKMKKRAIKRKLLKLIKDKLTRNILIIKPSALGDIITTLPSLSILHKSFPKAKISWLVRTELASILKDHPYLNDIILFDRKFLGKCLYKPQAAMELIKFLYDLATRRFDLVIDFQGLFRTAFFSWITGSKKRFGMSTSREFAHIFYTKVIGQDKNCIHLIDYYKKITAAAGAAEKTIEYNLPVNETAVRSIEKSLSEHNVNSNYAVLIPGSAHEDKNWPVERFAMLADKIHQRFDLTTIVTGTVSEKQIAERLYSITNHPAINLAGKTDISELTELIRGAALTVSNDTGPGHIAAALGIPVVLIFGRSNPARVAPYKRPDCFAAPDPYGRGFKADSFKQEHNITNVTVDEVFNKVCCQLKTDQS